MKHVANRSKSPVKPKAKTLAQAKTVAKITPASKKPIGKVALKSSQPKPVRETKTVAKVASKTLTNSKKTTVVKTAPKLSVKTLNALKTIPARKAKPAAKQIEKPKAKKIALNSPVKSEKNASGKTFVKNDKLTNFKAKPVLSAKKATAEKKVTKPLPAQKIKARTRVEKSKNIVKEISKSSVKDAKSPSLKAATRNTKLRLPKGDAIKTAKIKPVSQKAKSVLAAKKTANIKKTKLLSAPKSIKEKKSAATVGVKKVNQKPTKIRLVSPKKVVEKAVTAKSIAEPKKVYQKKDEITSIVEMDKTVWKRLKFKPAISAAKTNKPILTIKKNTAVEKNKPVENVIEEIKPPSQKPKNRKAKPISSAVFRGKKERYDFKVFELNDIFEPIPAVYIISKRKTDRNKKGHHALICIGVTDSISDELKRHRKGKCVKKHAANVVSILPETDEKIRLKIETDLKAAHTVACNLE